MMTSPRKIISALAIISVLASACGPTARQDASETPGPISGDPHSFARPDEVAVRHLDLDLTVDFESHQLEGRASLTLETTGKPTDLHLDTRQLTIKRVLLDEVAEEVEFSLGDDVPFLGRELMIPIAPDTKVVHIEYVTHPEAEALQWLTPEQTVSQKPFLFSQSQAILARTWIPCQDTPGVRMTYDATLRVPTVFMALMSASNPTKPVADGIYRFSMPQPIPSYLLSIAVGDLEFRSLGPRSGVYAEPEIVDQAAWEFTDVEQMMTVTEELYGPYLWDRYDILVLPPSFPVGGMEHPRLTFATPTILAGDRSLVSLVAHELAHSWSGNLVTNATWNDFWLNEGMTTYIQYRIMEKLVGPEVTDMLRVLGLQNLEREIEDLGTDSADTHLSLDLASRNPDDGMTNVAYQKGSLFLRRLEEAVGRSRWDSFLREYFEKFAFQSIDTATFAAYLKTELGAELEAAAPAPDLELWLYGSGLPDDHPTTHSPAFELVEKELSRFEKGAAAAELITENWITQHWLHFILHLPSDIADSQMADLDSAFRFTESGNSEIRAAWLKVAIRAAYEPAYPSLEEFLTRVGRRKFLEPLYREMVETPGGRDRAKAIYAKARPGYHAVAVNTLDPILGWN